MQACMQTDRRIRQDPSARLRTVLLTAVDPSLLTRLPQSLVSLEVKDGPNKRVWLFI